MEVYMVSIKKAFGVFQMPFQKKYMDEGEEDFTLESQPKRTAYKKINKKLRVKIVSMATQEGAQISELAKRYRINYSTISYIIRSHKGKTLPSSSPDTQLKQEATVEPEGEPQMATGSVLDPKDQLMKKQEAENIEDISKGVFEETQKIFHPYKMFLPVPFYFGGDLDDLRFFPFYPFLKYEGV